MQSRRILNDDILREVLGNLPSLDVVQCRRTCRRMCRITRERSLWSTIYRRCPCPLPLIDLGSAPVAGIERVISRAEVLMQNWDKPLTEAPNEITLLQLGPPVTSDTRFVGMHGAYVVYLDWPYFPGLPGSYLWLKIKSPDDNNPWLPVFKYDFRRAGPAPTTLEVSDRLAHAFDHDRGVLRISTVSSDGRMIHVTTFDTSRGFRWKVQTFQTNLWMKYGDFRGVKLIGDYLFCCQHRRAAKQKIELIHLPSEKKIWGFLHSLSLCHVEDATDQRSQLSLSSGCLVQVFGGQAVDVFELPDLSEWLPVPCGSSQGLPKETPPHDLRPVFSSKLPCQFTDIYAFPSSSKSAIVLVGEFKDISGLYQISLMVLDTAQLKFKMVTEGLSMEGISEIRAEQRLNLTHHPGTFCAAGIVFASTNTIFYGDLKATSESPIEGQKLTYLQVSLDDEPSFSMKGLVIPPELRESTLDGMNLLEGRIILYSGNTGYYGAGYMNGAFPQGTSGRGMYLLDYLQ